MTRTRIAAVSLPLFSVLVLMVTSEGIAGPPEEVSGKMLVDQVSEGLRRYRREYDDSKRVDILRKLAPTRDPRIAVAMGEFLSCKRNPFPHQLSVAWMLTEHFTQLPASDDLLEQMKAARQWWEANEADLSRRAGQLPK